MIVHAQKEKWEFQALLLSLLKMKQKTCTWPTDASLLLLCKKEIERKTEWQTSGELLNLVRV